MYNKNESVQVFHPWTAAEAITKEVNPWKRPNIRGNG